MFNEFLTRRDVLRSAAVAPLWLPVVDALFESDAFGQRAAKTQAKQEPLNRWPRMVHEFFVKQVREAERESLAKKNALKTKADAEKYVKDVRERIKLSFGKLPKRTPLKPRITGVLKRDGYNVEKLIFESRPGFLVTANLYVPTRRAGSVSARSPAVVGTCGHSSNGKAAGAYQSFSQGLAKQGYVVLIYDPIGQGERSQYVDDHLKDEIRVGTRQHLHAGNQQFLVGEFLGTWRAWDGIRALDYLRTRKEVDPKRIGVTGNSGGGTMTTWLCGVEQRWSMAAPSCFVTTFRRNMENELPADTEQCPPRALALGLDHDDFIAAMAPKPVILLAKEKDFFDVRGSEEAYARLKRLYKLLGHEENIALFTGPTAHGYSQENREAMYRWFNKATGVSKAKKEPALKLEKDEDLWCTPKGQVAGLKSKTVFGFTKDLATNHRKYKRLVEKGRFGPGDVRRRPSPLNLDLHRFLGIPTPRVTLQKNGAIIVNGKQIAMLARQPTDVDKRKLTSELRAVQERPGQMLFLEVDDELNVRSLPSLVVKTGEKLGFSVYFSEREFSFFFGSSRSDVEQRPRNRIPPFRTIRARPRNYPTKYHINYAVETEPGVHAVVTMLTDERWHSRPPKAGKRAILYVAHQSSDRELREEKLIKSVLSDKSWKGTPFFAVDVRGIGESRPGTAGADPYTNPYGADYFYAIHSLMLDRPYVGQRTHDVLRTLDWLRSLGHTEVHLVAKGWGAIPATFAAVLSNQVKQVTLKNALTSYHDLAISEHYDWPLSSMVPNVLKSFDLPDCYKALKAKNLKQIDPWGAKVKRA